MLIPRKCSHRWQARLPTISISWVYLPYMPNGQGVVYSKYPPTNSLTLNFGYFIGYFNMFRDFCSIFL